MVAFACADCSAFRRSQSGRCANADSPHAGCFRDAAYPACGQAVTPTPFSARDDECTRCGARFEAKPTSLVIGTRRSGEPWAMRAELALCPDCERSFRDWENMADTPQGRLF